MLHLSLKQRMRSVVPAALLLCTALNPACVLALPSPPVTLAWDPSIDPTVTSYHVYSGTASRAYTNVISAGASTNIIVSNLVSGVTYYFAATTYTAAGLESDYSTEVAYVAPSMNIPPTLDALPTITIAEDSGTQVVNLTGITSGSSAEVQNLSVSAFSSNPALIANPAVGYTSPSTTATLTFSPTPGSYGSTVVTVLIDDGGAISNTVIRTFTVNVVPIGNPPTIDPVTDLALNEKSGTQTVALTGITAGSTNSAQALMVTAVSSNPLLIPNPTINYSTPSTTGSLKFTALSNSYGSATITVTVSDAQPTNNTASISFNVAVNQTAFSPGVLTNISVAPNSTLRFLIPTPATNGDKFNINLAAGAPVGAKISTRKGASWLVWTPTPAQASTTNSIGLIITDNSNATLSTNETVVVFVQDYLGLGLGTTTVQAGQLGAVAFALSSSEAVTNLSFTVPWPNSLLNPKVSTSVGGISSSSLKAQGTNLLISLQTTAGQVLTGSNLLGSINFLASSTQASGYLNLPLANVVAYKPSAVQYANTFTTGGQVAIINNEAMLQAGATPVAARSLTILGKVGATYQVQYCTNFSSQAVWYPLMIYSQTNVVQTMSVDPSLPQAYYRVQQK